MSESFFDNSLETKLKELSQQQDDVLSQMNDGAVASNPTKMIELNKKLSRLRRVVDPYRQYTAKADELADTEEIMRDKTQDPELRALAESELGDLKECCEALAQQVKAALVTGDEAAIKSIIMEIRAGTGGNEAALFAGDLYTMYLRYCEQHRFKVEVLSSSAGEVGGFKEIILNIKGNGVFECLGYEGGGHRVQRVPETESQGRIHTSAATVAVLPEPEEIDINIDWDKEVEEFTMRSSGPGGQNVNKVESAVRLVHRETKISVSMRDEKSQHKNRAKARRILTTRLYDHHMSAQMSERASTRKAMIGSGDRSQRIRTYNFPQNRCTDHRIGLTLHNLDKIMMGDIGELIDAMKRHDRSERLKNLSFEDKN
ncbi:MAG: peptide chain release factor 1 [Planctomycetes bacterium]|nr:peptide chain release factor 1 [Planctomycetota bacterium]